MKRIEKKGVAEIITVLLLIALTVAIFSILAAFIIPAVRNYLDEGKKCYDVLGKVSVDSTDKTTCYNKSSGEVGVSIKRGDVDIDGMIIAVKGQGTSKSFNINNDVLDQARMYYKGYNESLELPGKNEQRTFVFNMSFRPENVVVAPVVSGKACKESEEVSISSC